MGVDANAKTLAEYAAIMNDPLVDKITMSVHDSPHVLKDIPLVTKETLIQNGVRYTADGLPGVNWAKINEVPVVTKGKPKPYQEQLYIVRNQFQVDKKILKDKNRIQDPLQLDIDAWMEAFAYDFNDKFINNFHEDTGDEDAPVGIRTRLDNPATFGVEPELKINAGGVDMTDSGMSTATANKFIKYVQTALDYLGRADGRGVVAYMNDDLKRQWEMALRISGGSGGFTILRDSYDRPVESYKEMKIRDIGRKVNNTTRVISSTETATGAADTGGTFTSMYFVVYGKDRFCGWQMEPLKPEWLGRDPTNGVMHNVVIDWGVGLWQPHTRAIARLYNIKVA